MPFIDHPRYESGFLSTIGSIFSSFIGSFDSGTDYVPRTGLALVHQGEQIIPKVENTRGRGGLSMVNNFHIAGNPGKESQQQIAAAAFVGA